MLSSSLLLVYGCRRIEEIPLPTLAQETTSKLVSLSPHHWRRYRGWGRQMWCHI